MAQALTEAEKHRDPEAEDVGGARGRGEREGLGGVGRMWMLPLSKQRGCNSF